MSHLPPPFTRYGRVTFNDNLSLSTIQLPPRVIAKQLTNQSNTQKQRLGVNESADKLSEVFITPHIHLLFFSTIMGEFLPYEGAGFLLRYADRFILGIRIKKADDKDQTPEVEYAGGKNELADKNIPSRTAHSELIEELGMDVLDPDWQERAVILHTFQPFSKKWIWCFDLALNPNEYARVLAADAALKNWDPTQTRDFSALTGRSQPARKALAEIVSVSVADFTNHVQKFSLVPKSDNRMSDAKKFDQKLKVVALDGSSERDFRVRGFNLVIFEEHFH
jgi:hypothetical protein